MSTWGRQIQSVPTPPLMPCPPARPPPPCVQQQLQYKTIIIINDDDIYRRKFFAAYLLLDSHRNTIRRPEEEEEEEDDYRTLVCRVWNREIYIRQGGGVEFIQANFYWNLNPPPIEEPFCGENTVRPQKKKTGAITIEKPGRWRCHLLLFSSVDRMKRIAST